MVENMKKLAWGARGSEFESHHSDSFFLGTYVGLTVFLKSFFLSLVPGI